MKVQARWLVAEICRICPELRLDLVYCEAMAKPRPLTDLTKTGVDFLRAELETGSTLADIALEAEDRAKIERNRKNARLAYDTVVRTRERVPLTEEQTQYVSRALVELRKKLKRLGEQFPAE